MIPDRELDFMPDTDGAFVPTVREPWQSKKELKHVKGRSKKGPRGRKTSSRSSKCSLQCMDMGWVGSGLKNALGTHVTLQELKVISLVEADWIRISLRAQSRQCHSRAYWVAHSCVYNWSPSDFFLLLVGNSLDRY